MCKIPQLFTSLTRLIFLLQTQNGTSQQAAAAAAAASVAQFCPSEYYGSGEWATTAMATLQGLKSVIEQQQHRSNPVSLPTSRLHAIVNYSSRSSRLQFHLKNSKTSSAVLKLILNYQFLRAA